MLANCDVLITRYSSTLFPALVLGKEVYSSLDNEELKKLVPIQNNGTSSKNIAAVANDLLNSPHSIIRVKEKNNYYSYLFANLKYFVRRKFERNNILN